MLTAGPPFAYALSTAISLNNHHVGKSVSPGLLRFSISKFITFLSVLCRESSNLTLGEPKKKDEVSNTYQQQLKMGGGKVLVQVPEFHRTHGLKFVLHQTVTAVLIPFDEKTKAH